MLVLSACEKIKFLSQNNSKKNLKTDTVKSVSVWFNRIWLGRVFSLLILDPGPNIVGSWLGYCGLTMT